MPGPYLKSARGFTLVEIVLALGVFSFAIIGIVFLLGTALQSSTATERDSALSAALTTTASLMRSYDNSATPPPTGTPAPTIFYFDAQGSQLSSATDGSANTTPDPKTYYLFTVTSLGTAGSLPNQQMYSVKVTAPYPNAVLVGTFLVSSH